ncbi:MAG TPA: hypothetical protein VLE69_03195 [Candidatus Saccharimonadales bacterium]|nr:hypothetical protein [Candidatus Saccharimonadales bacterium]
MPEDIPSDPLEIKQQAVDSLASFAEYAMTLQDGINAVQGEHREQLKQEALLRLNELAGDLFTGQRVICRGEYYVPGVDLYGNVTHSVHIEKDQTEAVADSIRIFLGEGDQQNVEIIGYSLIMADRTYHNWLDDTSIVYRMFAPVKSTTLELAAAQTAEYTNELITDLEGDESAEELDVILAEGDVVDFPSLSRVIEDAVDAELPESLLDTYMLHLDNITRLKGQTLTMLAPVIAIRESIDLVSFEYPKEPFVGEVLGFCMDSEITFEENQQSFSGNKGGLYLALVTPQHEDSVVLVPARFVEAYEAI